MLCGYSFIIEVIQARLCPDIRWPIGVVGLDHPCTANIMPVFSHSLKTLLF